MKTHLSPEDKSRRAVAYMQMSTQSDGWKYLRIWLEECIATEKKAVFRKGWQLSDIKDTARRQLAQTQAWTYNEVIKHVDAEISNEVEKREQARQGDAQK